MKKLLFAAVMAAFFMSKISVHAAEEETIEDIIEQQFLEQYQQQWQEQYEEQLAEQIEAASEQVTEVVSRTVSDYERRLMAQVVYAEAGNQDLTGKRLVAACILNRVDSGLWPNTIEEVIFQPNQFTTWYRGISDECYEAVDLELQERSDTKVIFFCSNGYSYYGRPAYKWGGHWFSYQ